jgi:hypothetical protein
LKEKYPHVEENIAVIEDAGGVVRYEIDATKMKAWTTGGKYGPGAMERIFFNFPHVGGKSTDVNRQVRYNQGMNVLCKLDFGTVLMIVSFVSRVLQACDSLLVTETWKLDHCDVV